SHLYPHSFPTRRSSDLVSEFSFKAVIINPPRDKIDAPAIESSGVAIIETIAAVVGAFMRVTNIEFVARIALCKGSGRAHQRNNRSEEHTSELQSRSDLV